MAALTQVRLASFNVLSANASSWTPSVTTWTVNTAISAGDTVLWVVAFAIDGTVDPVENSGNGWSVVYTKESTSQVTGGFALLLTTGAYAANAFPAIAFSFGAASEQATARVAAYRAGAGKTIQYIMSTGAQGNSTNSDPPSVTNNTGASQDPTFIAMRAGDGATAPSVASTGYGMTSVAGGANGATTTTESKQTTGWANAATEDPGVYTVATEQWVCYTVAFFEVTPQVNGASATSATTTSSPTVTGGVIISPAAAVSASTESVPTFSPLITPDALVSKAVEQGFSTQPVGSYTFPSDTQGWVASTGMTIGWNAAGKLDVQATANTFPTTAADIKTVITLAQDRDYQLTFDVTNMAGTSPQGVPYIGYASFLVGLLDGGSGFFSNGTKTYNFNTRSNWDGWNGLGSWGEPRMTFHASYNVVPSSYTLDNIAVTELGILNLTAHAGISAPQALTSATITSSPTVSTPGVSITPNSLTTKTQNRGFDVGPNLFTNADFASNITGWTAGGGATISYSAGKLRVTRAAAGYQFASQSPGDLPDGGAPYELAVDFSQPGAVRAFIGSTWDAPADYCYSTAASGTLREDNPVILENNSDLLAFGIDTGSGANGDFIEFDNAVFRRTGILTVTWKTVLTPAALTSASLAGVPTVTAHAFVTPAALTSASVISQPTVTAKAVITANGAASASTTSSPTITAHAAVSPASLTSASTTSVLTVAWKTSIAPADLTSGSQETVPSTVAHAVIAPNPTISGSAASIPSVASHNLVSPAASVSATTTSIPSFVTHLNWNDAYAKLVNQRWPEEAYFPEVFNATDIT